MTGLGLAGGAGRGPSKGMSSAPRPALLRTDLPCPCHTDKYRQMATAFKGPVWEQNTTMYQGRPSFLGTHGGKGHSTGGTQSCFLVEVLLLSSRSRKACPQ